MKGFTLKTFLRKYPHSDACLDEIFKRRYPNGVTCAVCKKITRYYKIKNRTAYSCEFCRTQIFPLAGTIFEKTTTDLRLWFYAMFLMIKTRSGISAKQLERELGVCYVTAHRMFKQIRLLMAQTPSLLSGIVEIDESFFGGKGFNRAHVWKGDWRKKEIIMGMVQRHGKAYLKKVPNTTQYTLVNQIKQNVSSNAHLMTDEHGSYKYLYEQGYFNHFTVVHSDGDYGKGLVHTNTIEGIWSHVKRGIYGVYHNVSKKYLQAYVDEYTWRYNHRNTEDSMFDELLNQVALVRSVKLV